VEPQNIAIQFNRGRSSTNLIAGGATCLSGGKGGNNWGKKKIAIISAYEHTKLKLTVFMLLGGPQNTIKSHLVFTALFCFAPFSVFSSRMSAPYSRKKAQAQTAK
jgi:hypothetical protein